jgi:ATP citrate (pro-S)-lyase
MMEDYELFTKDSQAFFYNLKGKPIQSMLDFDYLAKRETPSIAAIIHPGRKGLHKTFFGTKEILIPIYSTINEAVKKHPLACGLINFASFRSAYNSTKQALEQNQIKTVVIVAEGLPERQIKELIAIAKKHNKTIIGPSTVGGIIAGRFRIGYTGGSNENIIKTKLYLPGSVGFVSKSGGMMNEMFNIIARATDGINEGIAIGGDVFPGSTLLDHILCFEANPNIKMIVALGELGGKAEYEIASAVKEGKITKPIVMWVSGTCASLFPFEMQFGHAGAKAGKEEESAQAKNDVLREAGVIIPENFEKFEETIKNTFKKLGITMQEEETPTMPKDYQEAVKEGLVRRPTNFTCTISSDLGEEPTYNGIPLSKLIEENASLGKVIGLLWFKKELPEYFSKFLDMCLVICADHGPAVATAHNAIVTSRAGKDIITSLISGLTTIGDRHGGAIDGAARYFKEACDSGMDPHDFVESMKKKGIYIPGIGHKVKSKKNPDKRVELLKKFAEENFPATKYLDYALKVEEITLQKAENLILNVDGCIGVLFLDAMQETFSQEEIEQTINIGCLNGLFALSRSIGMIGHIIDQKRMNAPLYRHPVDDILYAD